MPPEPLLSCKSYGWCPRNPNKRAESKSKSKSKSKTITMTMTEIRMRSRIKIKNKSRTAPTPVKAGVRHHTHSARRQPTGRCGRRSVFDVARTRPGRILRRQKPGPKGLPRRKAVAAGTHPVLQELSMVSPEPRSGPGGSYQRYVVLARLCASHCNAEKSACVRQNGQSVGRSERVGTEHFAPGSCDQCLQYLWG